MVMPWIKYMASTNAYSTSAQSALLDTAKRELARAGQWFQVYTRRQHLPHEAPTMLVTIFDRDLDEVWHRGNSPFAGPSWAGALVGEGDFDTAWETFEAHCRMARLGEE